MDPQPNLRTTDAKLNKRQFVELGYSTQLLTKLESSVSDPLDPELTGIAFAAKSGKDDRRCWKVFGDCVKMAKDHLDKPAVKAAQKAATSKKAFKTALDNELDSMCIKELGLTAAAGGTDTGTVVETTGGNATATA